MSNVRMTAIKAGSYDGIPFAEGETFEVDPQYVETLEFVGLARRAKPPVSPTRNEPASAEPETEPSLKPRPPKK